MGWSGSFVVVQWCVMWGEVGLCCGGVGCNVGWSGGFVVVE